MAGQTRTVPEILEGRGSHSVTQKLIQQLERTDNTITRIVYHWVDNVLGGFVTEFSIDQFVSYSEAE